MDALGKSLIVILAVAAAVCIVPMASDSSDGYGDLDGVLIYEVNPWNNNEGVSLCNYGSTAVNLRGYWISDSPTPTSNEGYLEFTGSVTIQPGAVVVVASSEGSDPDFVDRDGVTVIYYDQDGSPVTKQKSFTLSNSGDDIYLWDSSGKIIDTVCYGNVTISDTDLWFGDSVSITRNVFFQRHGDFDNDTWQDWRNFVNGWTYEEFDPEDPDTLFDATVTPFLFPDSGGIPVYQALESARDSVYINVYLLTNSNVSSLLYDLIIEYDLEVKILIEGTPVDGSIAQYAPSLLALVEVGADVRMIGMGDSPRYVQDHAKYAIIDMKTVVITSENWTNDNLNGTLDDRVYSGSDDGNRGWGAVIESEGYAEYMYGIFMNDFDTKYGDVTLIEEEFDHLSPANLRDYEEPEDAVFPSYQAQVRPILSNDNSFDASMYYISNATERVYCEQQSLSGTYQDLSVESPLSALAQKANDGLDCKLIIGTGVSSYNDVAYRINATTQIEAAVLTTPYVHNKGIVADDVAIVSSVNWTPSSFFNNREAAVAIYSSEVADFYAQAFLNDHNQCYSFDGFSVDITEIQPTYPAGQEITLTVSVSPSGNYSYEWDLGDGSEPIVTDVPRVVCEPISTGDATAYVLTVTVTDLDTMQSSTVTANYTILAEGSGSGGIGDVDVDTSKIGEFISDNLYILAPIILIILALIAAVSRAGSKSKKGKKRK